MSSFILSTPEMQQLPPRRALGDLSATVFFQAAAET